MSRANRARRSLPRRMARVTIAGLAVGLSLAPQFGCGREYFRQWADQDVSEAVFEKSRDPRWSMDLFTIEPPALSRFADPYDVDRPPAPPDDTAIQALTPTPQLPFHQLMVPAEGTGYLDMLSHGPRYVAPPPAPRAVTPVPGYAPTNPPAGPEPDAGAPFAPPANSGTKPGQMTPNSLPAMPGVAPARPAGAPSTSLPQTRNRTRDTGVLLSAYQAPGPPISDPAPLPMPVQSGANRTPGGNGTQGRPISDQDRLKSPVPPFDPNPDAVDPNAPAVPRTDVPPQERREGQSRSAGFNAKLTPLLRDFNEAQAAGFPANSAPFVIGPVEALQLALVNNRAYQFNLEQVYVTALAVTLQRFGFQPQFYAGNSPRTAPPGGILNSGPNQFLYRTKETIGGQSSALNYSTVAGVGKLLSFGGSIAAGFANQTVFNFLGSKPSQPTVSSFLPMTFAQPFLSGGGRAVNLEPLTQAERNLVYQIRSFTRFRQDMIPTILTQNQNFDVAQGTAADPTPGYLGVLVLLQNVENDRRNVVAFQGLLELYQKSVQGSASSGISQIQVDQIASQLQSARGRLLNDESQYKIAMDSYKMELGLPPDTPCILDRSVTSGFRRVFSNLDEWAGRDEHDPAELDGIIGALPKLESIIVDDRELFRYKDNLLTQVYADTDKQQDFLLAAERIALENRLDLMNNRGALYDSWRQLEVTDNALKGVFNVTLTNQITTQPGNQNPFAFSDQAKQFSVVLNTELPLIRVAQRNNFRLALITYRRNQRLLQSLEDDVKQAVRQEIYQLINFAENYEIAKVNLLVSIRQRDTTLQNIIAPPTSAAGAADAGNQAAQTTNLITSINTILGIQNQLLQNWVQFQTFRLLLFRDIGLLPYDEWEAFYEFFPANTGGIATSNGSGGLAAPGPANPAPPGRP
ncbi:MAG: hypothetical protein JWN86_1304 [Planctomycetota bacterium]|nr:hypothetical protein [Planctomycetota bacterium]